MKIYAIAIYDISKNSFEKVQSAPVRTSRFFADNSLKDFEEHTLTLYSPDLLHTNRITCIQHKQEFHYLKKLDNPNILIAVVCQKQLADKEANYLLKNIEHAYIRPTVVKTSLETIILNPLGYTGRDLHILKIQEELDEAKVIMQNTIEAVTMRGENLVILSAKTQELENESRKFKHKTEELNSCCKM